MNGGGTSAEQVDLNGWQTDGPDANYTLFTWVVRSANGGSLSITSAPTQVVVGSTGTVGYAWSGLSAGTRYLGAVKHTGPDGVLGSTIIEITG